MNRILWLTFFLVACAGGQTNDPGGLPGGGGAAGTSRSGGAGGNVTSGGGGNQADVDGGAAGAADPTRSTEKKCGNGKIDPGEQCDGTNLGGESCATFQTGSTGTLLCTDCQFDESMCMPEDTGTIKEDTGY